MVKIARLILTTLLVAGAVASFPTAPAHAQKADPNGPIAKDTDVGTAPQDIDPYLEKFVGLLADYQNNYFAEHRVYAQMLSPYVTVPTDGKADLPDDIFKAPTDGVTADEIWKATGLEAFPATLTINVYDGPKGSGYEVVAQTKFIGLLFEKVVNIGPEVGRDHDWQEVKP